MRQKIGNLFSLYLLLALALSGCTVPTVGAAAISTADEAPSYGVSSDAPHAPAVPRVFCTIADCLLHAFVPELGADAPGTSPLSMGQYSAATFSPDGRTLAYYHLTDSYASRGNLAFVDLQAWTIHETDIRVQDWGVHIAYSPDGSRLILSSHERVGYPSHYRLQLVDVERRTQILEAPLHFVPSKVAFSADGAHVLVYGWTETLVENWLEHESQVARLSAHDLSVEWTAPLPDVQDGLLPPEPTEDVPAWIHFAGNLLQPGIALDRNAGKLYAVHADADKLTTVDFINERVRTVDIVPPQSWIERGIEQLLTWFSTPAHAKAMNSSVKQAILSPDGTRLFITGNMQTVLDLTGGVLSFAEEPLGLQVVDVATGTELRHLEDAPSGQLHLSPEGDRLYLIAGTPDPSRTHSRYSTWVYDAATLELVRDHPDYGIWPARRLDGRWLLTGSGPDQYRAETHVVLDQSGNQVFFAQTDYQNTSIHWLQAN
jgi:hypothetical protein